MGDITGHIGTSDLIITNSHAVKSTLFKCKTDNIVTIYNYVEIPPDASDKNSNIVYFTKKDATKLIILGTISEAKGQRDAILAVRQLVEKGINVELVVMGMPQEKYFNELKSLVKDNGLEECVKFFNFNANPYPVVKQSDMVIVCSRSEAFGRVIVEGMLFKKPVIGTNSGGIPELIKEGQNGLLYDPGKYGQLADKIEYLIKNKVRCIKLEIADILLRVKHLLKKNTAGKFLNKSSA
jgi:glycosyltransferase involved in cell wall biosynthesis